MVRYTIKKQLVKHAHRKSGARVSMSKDLFLQMMNAGNFLKTGISNATIERQMESF